MCKCILVDKIVQNTHNNELHWTEVKQNIMHDYAKLCTCIISPPLQAPPRGQSSVLVLDQRKNDSIAFQGSLQTCNSFLATLRDRNLMMIPTRQF